MKKHIDQSGSREDLTAEWFVVRIYSGEMTSEESNMLAQWLAQAPENQVEFDTTLAIWDKLGQLQTDVDILTLPDKEQKGDMPISSLRLFYQLAATVLVFVGLSFLITNLLIDPSDDVVTYTTAQGKQRTVSLEDGTQLVLNTSTKVRVDMSDTLRHVALDYGEVYFDVASMPDRPMRVTANKQVVTVLGTEFSVSLLEEEFEVAVSEGKVALDLQDVTLGAANLTPGESGDDSKDNRPSLSASVSPRVYLTAGDIASVKKRTGKVFKGQIDKVGRLQSWLQGMVKFDNEPLWKVVDEINRYSQRKVMIEGEDIMFLTISGSFRVDSLDILLNSIEDIYDLKVIRFPERYVITPPNEM